jgi:hypothetical protein
MEIPSGIWNDSMVDSVKSHAEIKGNEKEAEQLHS